MTDKFCLGDAIYAERGADGAVVITNQNTEMGAVSVRLKSWMVSGFVRWVTLSVDEPDGAPHCQYCGAKRERDCGCGPIAENN